MRRRIWCETVTAAELALPATIALLARFEVQPIVAVWPWSVDEARLALARFSDAGLSPALWPMLADADGRWVHAGNATAFCAFAERLAGEVGPREIVFDTEPPIAALRTTIADRALAARMLPRAADRAAFVDARDRIAAMVSELRGCGVVASAAFAAPVLFERPGGAPAWQARLGTPVDGIAYDHVSPMLYASMIEGWSRGVLAREDARAFLAWCCRVTAMRFGASAGASLGAVGTGAFGDEPTYRSPGELADDVAIARTAGVDDLALFDFGGVLRRPPAEAWLEAFTARSSPRAAPPSSWRAGAVIAAGRAAAVAFELAAPCRAV
jgi:hypothetical protein